MEVEPIGYKQRDDHAPPACWSLIWQKALFDRNGFMYLSWDRMVTGSCMDLRFDSALALAGDSSYLNTVYKYDPVTDRW